MIRVHPAVRRMIWALLLTVCFAAPAQSSDVSDTGPIADGLAKVYEGTFQWFAGGSTQKIRVEITGHDIRGGTIIVYGKARYDTDGDIINAGAVWKIDRATRRIEIWESSEEAENFESGGSYVGLISGRFKTILAIWTTKKTGEQGTLQLEAR